MDNRQLKKQRETAAKLSRPRPVELPSCKRRCRLMLRSKRIDVIEALRERDAALDALSEKNVRAMLKSLVHTMRRSHDEAREAGML